MKNNLRSWQIAFFSLLGLVMFIVITAVVLFHQYFPDVTDEHFTYQSPLKKEATFTIQTNKERLNTLIATRIEENPSDVPYMVELLEDKVQFKTAFQVLGQRVPVTINFLPEVVNNGDVILKVETFSLGLLNLPVEQALQLISTWIEFADWIVTYPAERIVEVKVTEIKIENNDNISFQFTTFDLQQDKIELEMVVD
jgi:uncharacterized protein YpmS